MNKVTFGATAENAVALNKTAAKYRRELLKLPVIGCQHTLRHMTVRTGIRYSETVGEMEGDLEFGPYSETRKADGDIVVNPRDLQTYFGSVIKDFSPNSVYQSIYGSSITKGEGLKTTEITRMVVSFLCAQLGRNLNKHIWNAVRNDGGSKTKDLFNGFDTITAGEIAGGGISVAKGNLYEFTEAITSSNAVEVLKAFYRAASDELRGDETEQVNTKLFIPKSVFDAYNDDYQQTVGAVPYNREYKKTFLEGSDNTCELVPLVNKKGSPYIHLSPRRNMLVGVNQEGEEEQLLVERFSPLTLTFTATMFFGCQFESIDPRRLLVGKLFNS